MDGKFEQFYIHIGLISEDMVSAAEAYTFSSESNQAQYNNRGYVSSSYMGLLNDLAKKVSNSREKFKDKLLDNKDKLIEKSRETTDANDSSILLMIRVRKRIVLGTLKTTLKLTEYLNEY